jgi:hypothetical protein
VETFLVGNVGLGRADRAANVPSGRRCCCSALARLKAHLHFFPVSEKASRLRFILKTDVGLRSAGRVARRRAGIIIGE